MYTIRIKSAECYEVIVNKDGLDNLIALLDKSQSVEAFQVWCAGIGMVGPEAFGWGECKKWTNELLYNK